MGGQTLSRVPRVPGWEEERALGVGGSTWVLEVLAPTNACAHTGVSYVLVHIFETGRCEQCLPSIVSSSAAMAGIAILLVFFQMAHAIEVQLGFMLRECQT